MNRRERRKRKFLRWTMGNLYPHVWHDIRDPNWRWMDAESARRQNEVYWEIRHQQAPPVNRRFRRQIRGTVAWGDILRTWPRFTNRQIALAHHGTGRYVILCPFHDEKTPSLWLYPDGGFKCHGCGKAGDMLDFVNLLRPLRTTRDIKAFFCPLMQPLSSA